MSSISSFQSPRRIHNLIEPWVQSSSQNAIAIADQHYSLTYQQLQKQVSLAVENLEQLGLKPGDRLMVVGENSVLLAVLFLACSQLDAWFCIVNARLSPREITNIKQHAQPRLVIFATENSSDALVHAQNYKTQSHQWFGIGRFHCTDPDPCVITEPVQDLADQQVAALIYTSGTSGQPKGVMLTHANIAFNALSLQKLRQITPKDTSYVVLPMAHVVGLATQLMGCLASGATAYLVARFDPQQVAYALNEQRITMLVGAPALYAKLYDWYKETKAVIHAPDLRFIGLAGAPLTHSLKVNTESMFGLSLHNGYGLTECGPTIAQTRITAPRTDCSVGLAIPQVETRILDDKKQPVALGEIGELWVRSPGLMKGYYRDIEQTQKVIDKEGWFNTEDKVWQEKDLSLHIAGRSKELIIRSGLNVYPLEVEQVINTFPFVIQSAVVGKSIDNNEEVVAFIEVSEPTAIHKSELVAYLRSQLAPYKVPSEIHFMTSLPAAATGKILKNKLKEWAQENINMTAT